ncbi:hypothetical protein P3T23_006959 [Paraburkholderia sp. GAS448]
MTACNVADGLLILGRPYPAPISPERTLTSGSKSFRDSGAHAPAGNGGRCYLPAYMYCRDHGSVFALRPALRHTT